MKFLALLSVFFLITAPTFAAEESKDDLLQKSVNGLLKCDASGESSAKLLSTLLGLIFATSNLDDKATAGFTKDGDAAMEDLTSAKSCQDYDKAYHELNGVLKKYSDKDPEEELKKPEVQAQIKEMAKEIRESAAEAKKP
ncbi:MAG: hypothetical protein ACXVBE_15700 [Bdellovibrionota bacterium]